MAKIVVISDSFKGTFSSKDICAFAQQAFDDAVTAGELAAGEVELVAIPVADGGEGTLDCFAQALGDTARFVDCAACGPFFGETLEARYLLLDDGSAIIEAAQCVGLPLVGGRANPEITTTYGVGELMRDALACGARRIVLGLGGTATNDAGCGMACALGARFVDDEGVEFVPVGATLERIARVDLTEARELLAGVEVLAMCDVDNPLAGPQGAAYVFGPQKGADPAMVQRLDEGLAHLAPLMNACASFDVADAPGAGAAGGLGAGVVAFAGGKLEQGIEVVLDTVHADAAIKGAALVVTGEGRFDMQSLHGKVVSGAAKRAVQCGVPVVVIAGGIDADARAYVEARPELGIRKLIEAPGPKENYINAFRTQLLG